MGRRWLLGAGWVVVVAVGGAILSAGVGLPRSGTVRGIAGAHASGGGAADGGRSGGVVECARYSGERALD